MTTVYFVRHAQSDNSVRNGRIRPLTEKGLRDCALVTYYLSDKNIDMVFSSPFKRAIDTVSGFAKTKNLQIQTIEDLRERTSDKDMTRANPEFDSFMGRQWSDYFYTYSDGESLQTVQNRNITALKEILEQHNNKNIVIGTHGTALSTIINYYDNTYGYKDFLAMVNIMPWIVKMAFDNTKCINIQKINLFD